MLTQPLCCRYIDPMLGINAAELAILLAVVVATPLYFIVRLAVLRQDSVEPVKPALLECRRPGWRSLCLPKL